MEKTVVKSIYRQTDSFMGKKVELSGWVKTIRASNAFGFIELNDGSFFKNIQIVFESGLNNFKDISKLGTGSAIRVTGQLVRSEGDKQPFEIKADAVEIVGTSDEDFPLQKKRHTFEYMRTIAHLRPRANAFNAVFRVRSLVAHAIHTFFADRGFVYVHTPIITGSDCEGAGEMFKVTTLDLNNIPRNETGKIDYSQDFFGH
ncbi:MAG TPA: OB-fold nucleic acid binding domain-containing protein, partial [bacterium]|nr:OB-fold nucleic acid binding domain-containing protein [bacterium]